MKNLYFGNYWIIPMVSAARILSEYLANLLTNIALVIINRKYW